MILRTGPLDLGARSLYGRGDVIDDYEAIAGCERRDVSCEPSVGLRAVLVVDTVARDPAEAMRYRRFRLM